MTTYLSIDLDYFNDKPPEQLVKFFYKVRNWYGKPILVESHEGLVQHVNDTKPKLLINVDMHSDYLEFEELKEGLNSSCHCGNWVNYVKDVPSYRWLAPNRDVTAFRRIMFNGSELYLSKGKGRGDNIEEFYTRRGKANRHIPDAKIWYGLSRINWDGIAAIGIAISSEYTSSKVLERFLAHCLPLFKYNQLVCGMSSVEWDNLLFTGVDNKIREEKYA